MINLRAEIKDDLDATLDRVNVARARAKMCRFNRSDLVQLMLKKLSKDDYVNPNL
jgi:hypothetical protein